ETGGPSGVRAAAARRAPGVYHVRAYAGSAPARWLPQLRAARLSDGLVSTSPGAHPEQRRNGLRVGDAAVAHHGERLVERRDQRLDEFARVELGGTLLLKLASHEQLDRLVGIGNGGVDD